MTQLDFGDIAATRRIMRRLRRAQSAQMMLVAAGIAAFGIVGVAASMMVVWF